MDDLIEAIWQILVAASISDGCSPMETTDVVLQLTDHSTSGGIDLIESSMCSVEVHCYREINSLAPTNTLLPQMHSHHISENIK